MIGGVANHYVPNAKLLYCCLIISATPFALSSSPTPFIFPLCDSGTATRRQRMMKGTAAEVAVFADTDLGTHIAFNVPPHITTGALKSKNNRNTTY